MHSQRSPTSLAIVEELCFVAATRWFPGVFCPESSVFIVAMTEGSFNAEILV